MLDAIRELGCRAVISQGSAGLGKGPLPEGVIAAGTISHAQLFPRVAAVVHHGGAGTTAVAARSGVPQIIVPHIAAQLYWAERVNLLGLGPPGLRRAGLTSERLVAALHETIGNEILCERAQDLGQQLRSQDATRPSRLRLLSDT